MSSHMPIYRTTKNFKSNHKSTKLECSNCGNEFLANRKTAKFCSSSCRSGYWLNKNQKRVITLAVPADIDEDFLEDIRQQLMNYKSKSGGNMVKPTQVQAVSRPENEQHIFESEQELESYLKNMGFSDFRIPKIDMGIYYDEGLMIKKTMQGWNVTVTFK